MEKELIRIKTNENNEPLVSARELHEKLESKERFSKWFSRMLEYGFIENQEFTSVHFSTVVNNGAEREVGDYVLKLDMAKEICMIQRSEIGKKFRQYFIECEKKLKQNAPALPTYAEALRQLADKVEENERLQLENKEMKPKAEFFDAVADSKDAISMNEVAKVLAIKGMGRNNLFEFLRQNKILMSNNVPFQTYVDRGYFRVIEQKYMKQGEPCMNIKTLVYQKGVEFIRRTIEEKTTGNIN